MSIRDIHGQETKPKFTIFTIHKSISSMTQFQFIEYFICLLNDQNILDIVISPGSRNAPMIEALDQHGKFNMYAIPDERSAAFFGMGLTLKSGKPTVLLCTSGSALLNYAPGVSEAFYQGLPMIVISADRPEYLVGQMAGQTIHQNDALKNFVKATVNLNTQVNNELVFEGEKRKIHQALINMNDGLKGPVHINFPIEEPFYGHQYHFNHNLSFPKKIKANRYSIDSDLQEIWNEAKSILVLVGCLNPNPDLEKTLSGLNEDERLVILHETTSNLHLENSVACIDHLMVINEKEGNLLEPELVLCLGRNVVSKKIKTFIKQSNVKHLWSFDNENHLVDTYGHLSHQIQVDENVFLSQLNTSNQKSSFKESYINPAKKALSILEEYQQELDFCDFKVFDLLYKEIPHNSVIHYGNSSVVRYSNLFDNQKKNYTCFANRGTSGIDGSVSTAVGYANKSHKPNYLIIGDISFMYDSNGLWNKHIPDNLKIIVINNGGGGIFDIIPGAKDSRILTKYLKYEKPGGFCLINPNILSSNQNHEFSISIKPVTKIDTYKNDNSKKLNAFFKML